MIYKILLKIYKMTFKYLTVEEIIKMHDSIIKETGGHSGIQNYGNLDFTVEQMKEAKDLFTKAAVLMRGIIERHPFIDGNKRTGLQATASFLNANGFDFDAEEKQLKEIALNIATGKLKLPEIIKWLNENTKRI